jgi:hypothetical protein
MHARHLAKLLENSMKPPANNYSFMILEQLIVFLYRNMGFMQNEGFHVTLFKATYMQLCIHVYVLCMCVLSKQDLFSCLVTDAVNRRKLEILIKSPVLGMWIPNVGLFRKWFQSWICRKGERIYAGWKSVNFPQHRLCRRVSLHNEHMQVCQFLTAQSMYVCQSATIQSM